MTTEKINENKGRFLSILSEIDREGLSELCEWLSTTTFFEDPASTKNHLAEPGGLCQHSLNVYDCLLRKAKKDPLWNNMFTKAGITCENLAIAGLLHDLCKTGTYEVDYKNVKERDEDILKTVPPRDIKQDEIGSFVWVAQQIYKYNDENPLGHGEKSIFMALQYIKLTTQELYAIRWHMGAFDAESSRLKGTLSQALEKFPLTLAIIEADMEATFCIENETGEC